MNAYPAAEGGLVKSASVAKSGGARDHGLSTGLDEEMEKLARQKFALSSCPARTEA